MFLLKKFGMAVVYFILASVINTNANYIFASGGILSNAITIPSIILCTVILFAISRYLRIGKLKKNHKGDDSPEKAIFNGETKEKLLYIAKTPDFKLEAVLAFIFSVYEILRILFAAAFQVGFPAIFSNTANIALLIGWILIVPVYFSAMNLFCWLAAYNGVYKRKEF